MSSAVRIAGESLWEVSAIGLCYLMFEDIAHPVVGFRFFKLSCEQLTDHFAFESTAQERASPGKKGFSSCGGWKKTPAKAEKYDFV